MRESPDPGLDDGGMIMGVGGADLQVAILVVRTIIAVVSMLCW